MGRVTEAIIRFMVRQELLQRFEKEVAKGEVATVDVLLRKGIQYAVKGTVSKGRGTPILSLGDRAGFAVPTNCFGKGNSFYVTPERDGGYTIRAAIEPAAADRGSATVSITLCAAIPLPRYVTWPVVIEEEPAEELPVRKVAV